MVVRSRIIINKNKKQINTKITKQVIQPKIPSVPQITTKTIYRNNQQKQQDNQ